MMPISQAQMTWLCTWHQKGQVQDRQAMIRAACSTELHEPAHVAITTPAAVAEPTPPATDLEQPVTGQLLHV